MHPTNAYERLARELLLFACIVDFRDDHHPGTRRQLLQTASDGRQCSLIADKKVTLELHRNDGGAAGTADHQGVAHSGMQRPVGGGSRLMNRKIDMQQPGTRLVSRGVVAHGWPLRRTRFAGKKQLDMVIESKTGKSGEFIPRQADSQHLRRYGGDSVDLQPPLLHLMAHAADFTLWTIHANSKLLCIIG